MAKVQLRIARSIAANDVVRMVRKYRGLTLPAVESRTRIQASDLSNFETGKKTPGAQRLMRLATTFRVHPAALGGDAEAFESLQKNAKKSGLSDGQMLRMIRLSQGLSQRSVAELTGIATPAICRLERDKIPLGKNRAQRLISALQVKFPIFSALW